MEGFIKIIKICEPFSFRTQCPYYFYSLPSTWRWRFL